MASSYFLSRIKTISQNSDFRRSIILRNGQLIRPFRKIVTRNMLGHANVLPTFGLQARPGHYEDSKIKWHVNEWQGILLFSQCRCNCRIASRHNTIDAILVQCFWEELIDKNLSLRIVFAFPVSPKLNISVGTCHKDAFLHNSWLFDKKYFYLMINIFIRILYRFECNLE